jgi:hypothetical protein
MANPPLICASLPSPFGARHSQEAGLKSCVACRTGYFDTCATIAAAAVVADVADRDQMENLVSKIAALGALILRHAGTNTGTGR